MSLLAFTTSTIVPSSSVSSDCSPVQSFFASQSLHNRKKFKKKSGDVNVEANFSFFILPPLHYVRAVLPARSRLLHLTPAYRARRRARGARRPHL
jgi:hypothetical protein